MPFYRTHVLQDAWIHHNAVVEAASPEEAAHMAYRAWRGDDNGVVLEEGDAQGFDDAQEIDPEDVEEITEEEYRAELEPAPPTPSREDKLKRIAVILDEKISGVLRPQGPGIVGVDAAAEAILQAIEKGQLPFNVPTPISQF